MRPFEWVVTTAIVLVFVFFAIRFVLRVVWAIQAERRREEIKSAWRRADEELAARNREIDALTHTSPPTDHAKKCAHGQPIFDCGNCTSMCKESGDCRCDCPPDFDFAGEAIRRAREQGQRGRR
jgi:hypothetical protein